MDVGLPCSAHTRKHNYVRTAIQRPSIQEGPALPPWALRLRATSEATLGRSTHFTCTPVYFSQPPYVDKLIRKTIFLDNFNIWLKNKMFPSALVPIPP